jgi:hypothetical protein
MAVVKLRERDKETLEKLASSLSKIKGETSNSEVVGLSLSFANSNMDRFLEIILNDIKDEPLIRMLRKPAGGGKRGVKTDARKIEEYLYGTR